MRKPSSSQVGTTTLKTEIIEIDSDSDSDEVGGRMLALCGEVNASCKLFNTSAEDAGTNKTNMQIVRADDCASHLEYDLDYKKYLASCRENHHHPYLLERDISPVRILYIVDNEAIDRSKGRELNDEKSRARRRSEFPLISSVSKKLKTENAKEDHKSNSRTVFRTNETQQRKEISLRGRKIALTKNTIKLEPTSSDDKDTQHEKEVARRGRKTGLTKNTIKLEATSGKDTQQEKEVAQRERKKALTKNTIKLEPTSGDGRVIRQEKEVARRGRKIALTKNTIKLEPTSNVQDTRQEKEDARRGRKIALTKNTIKLKPTSNVKDNQQKKEDGRRGRKSSVTKNNFKACKLETEERSERRNAKPQTILRASKRLKAENINPMINTKENQRKKDDARQGKKISVTKSNFKACKKRNEESSARRASKRLRTENGRADHNSISRTIPVVKTKDAKQKKGEPPREKKTPVTKNNVKSMSTSHVKDNLLHSFKAQKKEKEESRLLVDKSYEYFLAYLRNSITVFEPGRNVKPEKDIVSLSDPDIIAVSDYPFSDGLNSPFEANKNGKVIDLEDGIGPDNIFNSSFSKKLLEILRKPYDKNEFLQRCHDASHKRQMTRSRQLRDGREIEYIVDDQLGRSYLDQYPDFKRVFRRCRYRKDDPRALNLLRGFFFYFENIVLEGAFKPWLYETRLKSECKDIVCIK